MQIDPTGLNPNPVSLFLAPCVHWHANSFCLLFCLQLFVLAHIDYCHNGAACCAPLLIFTILSRVFRSGILAGWLVRQSLNVSVCDWYIMAIHLLSAVWNRLGSLYDCVCVYGYMQCVHFYMLPILIVYVSLYMCWCLCLCYISWLPVYMYVCLWG